MKIYNIMSNRFPSKIAAYKPAHLENSNIFQHLGLWKKRMKKETSNKVKAHVSACIEQAYTVDDYILTLCLLREIS